MLVSGILVSNTSTVLGTSTTGPQLFLLEQPNA